MKKLTSSLILLLFVAFSSFAQTKQMMIKKNEKGFFLDHSVAPKEGLYSIGRVYNVHPHTIATFNNIDINKGLNIGQVIQIPLTDTNFSQKGNKGVPLYYVVKEKEGLLTVSNMNNGVTMQSIRDWNNLKSDKLNVGTKLIVGYLVNEPANTDVAKKPETPENAVKENPSTTSGNNEIAAADPIAKKEEKPVESPVKANNNPVATPPTAKTENNNDAAQGYFKSSFDQQTKAIPITKNETVTSGIFKTTSGWEDAKYYLLMDKVQAGTVVKIINPDNNKAIFAKVLGQMNGIRQNEGLDIRISNAAAAALNISENEKFIVKVNY